MIIWIDAQLSPALAKWIEQQFGIKSIAVRDLVLRDASDDAIFRAARGADAWVLTKDADFAVLLERFGAPPKVIWLRCGNSSNANVRRLLETLVEITDPQRL